MKTYTSLATIIVLILMTGLISFNNISNARSDEYKVTFSPYINESQLNLDFTSLDKISLEVVRNLGLIGEPTHQEKFVITMGQWMTYTEMGVNLELFNLSRETPIYVVSYHGQTDGKKLNGDGDTNFKYENLIVSIRADTGEEMGSIAYAVNSPESFKLDVALKDNRLESSPPMPMGSTSA